MKLRFQGSLSFFVDIGKTMESIKSFPNIISIFIRQWRLRYRDNTPCLSGTLSLITNGGNHNEYGTRIVCKQGF